MTPSQALLLWLIATAFVVVVAGRPAGARLALLAAVLLLPLPAFVRAGPVALGLLAFATLGLFVVAVEFAHGPRPPGLRGRVAGVLTLPLLVDAQHLRRAERHFDAVALRQLALALLVAGLALLLWRPAEALPALLRGALRSAAGAMVVLALAEIMTALVTLGAAALGWAVRPVHDAPYRSRSVSEFWNRRWNPRIGRWLHRHVYAHVARRGVLVATVVTFSMSALLHAYLLLAIDLAAALSWAAFFLAQPLLVLAERRLRVRRWPTALGHAWTVGTLALLFPLLLWPLLPLFDTSL